MNDKSTLDPAGERIAKVIARAGLGSRREAELWIAAGRVAVNGAVIDSPARNVTARDRISVDGNLLPARARTRLFLYNKPRALVTTRVDPRGRPTIFERLPKHLPRLISVGRLDFNTEGLLLLTNDGGLARILELPATGWLRRYRVRAHGSVTQNKLDELRAGVVVDGIRYGAIEATLDRVQGTNLWLTFAVREGKNREVRNVLAHLGLAVTRLIRVSFGPFQLADLPEGEVEEVRTRVLREQLGERVAALSGADFSAPMVGAAPEKSAAAHPRARNAPAIEKSRDHAWRAQEQERPATKLRRKFHGSRRDAQKPRERPAQPPRSSVLEDRKGRRVLVERIAPPPSAHPSESNRGDAPPRRGARPRHKRPRRR